MSKMQAFYSNIVVSSELEQGSAMKCCVVTTAVADTPAYLQALRKLTKVTLAELSAIESQLGWPEWWGPEAKTVS